VCSAAGNATSRRAGARPPAWIRWARPGRHSVPVRERVDSQAGCRPLPPVVSFSGRRPTPACPRLGAPNSVLERCGPRAESVARAQGQPGRESGQGQRASLRAGSPAGPGVEHPAASGRCWVLTRRGPLNRDAQWQDADRFSRAVEPAGRKWRLRLERRRTLRSKWAKPLTERPRTL
jgi:hypothetical protein